MFMLVRHACSAQHWLILSGAWVAIMAFMASLIAQTKLEFAVPLADARDFFCSVPKGTLAV
jgi:hypothetical protein